MPEKVIAQLREDLGAKAFDGLTEQERLILITAHIEITVDHNRMISMLTIHPRDLSNIFSGLVARELLIKEGTGRGTVYCLPSARARDLVNEMTDSNPSSGGLSPRPRGLSPSSGGLSPGGFEPELWGFEPKLWGFEPETQGFEPELWGFEPELWGFEPELWGFEPELWGFEPELWGFEPELWGFGPELWGFGPETQGFGAIRDNC